MVATTLARHFTKLDPAHLVAQDHADTHHVLDAALSVMEEQFEIHHSTFQVEPTTHRGCDAVAW